MKRVIVHCYITVISFVMFSCNSDSIVDKEDDNPIIESENPTIEIKIDVSDKYQIIDGFGASDCGTPHFVGKYWSDIVKEDISRHLFSREIKNGKPQGIGLSIWRFNLGGGTMEQGEDSDIENKASRAECFLNPDMKTYDWNKQEGQQYFLRKAYDYGCREFVMFSNTPPVYFTNNGKGYSNSGVYSNLKREHYDDFANFISDVVYHFKYDEGIEFTQISPVNEPQYKWNTPSQEGSGWTNSNISLLAKEIDRALEEKGLSNTNILLAEAGDWEYTYKVKNDSRSSNVIYSFWDTGSSDYIGNLKHLLPVICAHSYWTDSNWDMLVETRTQLKKRISSYNLKAYQTEWSMLGDNYNDSNYPGHEKAKPIDIALYMSQVIYHDLVSANISSWSFWTSMGLSRWGHQNRFVLITVIPAEGPYGDVEKGGTYAVTPSLWVLGNYSLFIRPGYQRVGLNIPNNDKTFFGSAYISPDNKQLVSVFTNMKEEPIDINISLSGTLGKIIEVKSYTTSEKNNLTEEVLMEGGCTIPAKSVVTIVQNIE